MALTLALATIRMATLHASLFFLLPSPFGEGSGVRLFLSPSGELEGGHTLSVYNNVKSLIIIVQNTLF